MDGWRYYNHALLPTTAPHIKPNVSELNNYLDWFSNIKRIPLFARYTVDFDCGYETNWWYVIKDTPFDIMQLKAKRRYEINKGNKNFVVKEIAVEDYLKPMYSVYLSAISTYGDEYNPIDQDAFSNDLLQGESNRFFAAFENQTDKLVAYAICVEDDLCIYFSVLKAIPEYEKYGLNAAVVCGILSYYDAQLSSGEGYYISDGERSILHETLFQEYLEKYFGFRKAYCLLKIKYIFPVNLIVNLLYPFKDYIEKQSGTLFKKVYSVLLMESYVKEGKENY